MILSFFSVILSLSPSPADAWLGAQQLRTSPLCLCSSPADMNGKSGSCWICGTTAACSGGAAPSLWCPTPITLRGEPVSSPGLVFGVYIQEISDAIPTHCWLCGGLDADVTAASQQHAGWWGEPTQIRSCLFNDCSGIVSFSVHVSSCRGSSCCTLSGSSEAYLWSVLPVSPVTLTSNLRSKEACHLMWL